MSGVYVHLTRIFEAKMPHMMNLGKMPYYDQYPVVEIWYYVPYPLPDMVLASIQLP